jgi:hypothetical protein
VLAGTYALALGGGVDQLLAERLPVAVGRGLLDDDLTVVVGQLEDDVLVLLVKLQVVEGRYALLCDGSSVAKRRGASARARIVIRRATERRAGRGEKTQDRLRRHSRRGSPWWLMVRRGGKAASRVGEVYRGRRGAKGKGETNPD